MEDKKKDYGTSCCFIPTHAHILHFKTLIQVNI
jgi:hypothetical protein